MTRTAVAEPQALASERSTVTLSARIRPRDVMWRRGCAMGAILMLLPSGVGVVRANPLPEPSQASAALSSRAIERQVRELARSCRDELCRAHSPDPSQTPTRLKRCTSTKKGLLIGAAIGAVASGALATYIERGLGGVRRDVVLQFAAGGAAIGGFVGFAYCR